MDKEKILSTLRDRLGTTSLSERTLNTYIAATFSPDADPSEEQIESAVNVLTSLQGQYNHDIAEAKRQFTTAQIPNEPPASEKSDDAVLKRLQELEQSNAKLLERLDNQDAQARKAELLSTIETEMRAKNATNGYVIKNVLRSLEIADGESVENLVQKALERYDKEFAEATGTTAAPRQNDGAGVQTKSRSDEYFAQKRKRENW